MARRTSPTSAASGSVVALDEYRKYLYDRELLPRGLVPAQLLIGAPHNVVVRFAELVLKRIGPNVEHPEKNAHPSDIVEVMARAGALAPEVLWADDDANIVVTRFVDDRNWGRLLAAGNIDFRTYGVVGRTLGALHARLGRSRARLNGAPAPTYIDVSAARDDSALAEMLYAIGDRLIETTHTYLHGDLVPSNILLGLHSRVVFTGWKGRRLGDPLLDVATLLAEGVAHSVLEPHTFDSYVDAGRSFLAGYGGADSQWLTELIGALLLGHGHRCDDSVLWAHGRALVLAEAFLPWA